MNAFAAHNSIWQQIYNFLAEIPFAPAIYAHLRRMRGRAMDIPMTCT